MANGSFFVDYDNTGGEKSNDSPSSSQSPSPSESKEKETTTPVNIRDEICSSVIFFYYLLGMFYIVVLWTLKDVREILIVMKWNSKAVKKMTEKAWFNDQSKM